MSSIFIFQVQIKVALKDFDVFISKKQQPYCDIYINQSEFKKVRWKELCKEESPNNSYQYLKVSIYL